MQGLFMSLWRPLVIKCRLAVWISRNLRGLNKPGSRTFIKPQDQIQANQNKPHNEPELKNTKSLSNIGTYLKESCINAKRSMLISKNKSNAFKYHQNSSKWYINNHDSTKYDKNWNFTERVKTTATGLNSMNLKRANFGNKKKASEGKWNKRWSSVIDCSEEKIGKLWIGYVFDNVYELSMTLVMCCEGLDIWSEFLIWNWSRIWDQSVCCFWIK